MPKNQAKPKSIKGIPDELYRESKANAARQGKTIGQYLSEALIAMNAQVMGNKSKN